MKTSFVTSVINQNQSGMALFGSLKVEKGLALFPGDHNKAFSVAHELEFDGIEISVADPEEIPLVKLKNLSDHHQIGISAFLTGGVAVRDGLIFTSPDKSIRKAAVQRIKKIIEFASFFKAVVIVGLVKGGINSSFSHSMEHITECLTECNDYSMEKGVYIALEPINRFQEDFFHSIIDCKRYLDKIKLSNVKMMIDSFHMNIEDDDMWENIREARDYIVHVHCSDNNRLAPGMGHFNFMKMTKVLKEIGYNNYVSAEILPVPDSFSAAKKSIESMKLYLNQQE